MLFQKKKSPNHFLSTYSGRAIYEFGTPKHVACLLEHIIWATYASFWKSLGLSLTV